MLYALEFVSWFSTFAAYLVVLGAACLGVFALVKTLARREPS